MLQCQHLKYQEQLTDKLFYASFPLLFVWVGPKGVSTEVKVVCFKVIVDPQAAQAQDERK